MKQGVVRAVFVGAMVIAMMVALCGGSKGSASGFLDGNWLFKRVVTVHNPNPFPLTQYPVSLTLDTQSLISAGKLKADGSDLRLTHNNVQVEFAVADINTAVTKIEFKADAPANGSNLDYALYYGNPSASDVSVSHEKIAYEVIDEFNDGVIDPMWSFNADTVNRYEAGGYLYVEKGPTGCSAEATLTGRNVSNSEILHIQFRSYTGEVGWGGYNGIYIDLSSSDGTGGAWAGAVTYDKRANNAAPGIYFSKTGVGYSSEISAYRCDWTQVNNQWHDYAVYWNESSNVYRITMDGTYYDQENSMGWFEDSSFKFSFAAGAYCPSGRSYAKFDYMRVWQEVSVEPTTATGAEETTDTTPPTTTISLSGTLGNNGWYTSDVEVALSAADEEGGSGVAKTEYSFNGSDWITYTVQFPVSTEGTTTVYYRSTDNAGNVEPTKTEAIKIDKTAPSIGIISPANGAIYRDTDGPIPVQLLVADNCDPSPVVTMTLDGEPFVDDIIYVDGLDFGPHEFTATATDHAGNSGGPAVSRFELRPGTRVLAGIDSTNRAGVKNTNEGANPYLSIGETHRIVTQFDMTGVPLWGVKDVKLVFTIDYTVRGPGTGAPDNWGTKGRPVCAYRLLEKFVEGNGKELYLLPADHFRGFGAGVTWNCAVDLNIANEKRDPDPTGFLDFSPTPTDTVIHRNNMTGQVTYNVTRDVLNGACGWMVEKPSAAGNARYYSKEGAQIAGNPALAPRLVVTYN